MRAVEIVEGRVQKRLSVPFIGHLEKSAKLWRRGKFLP